MANETDKIGDGGWLGVLRVNAARDEEVKELPEEILDDRGTTRYWYRLTCAGRLCLHQGGLP
jgi:hypothetical protein